MEELNTGWQIIEGRIPILVVAGHNFGHGRAGKMKWADMGTGEVARRICEKFGLWGIISTRVQMDPNWYTNSPFREKVKAIIKQNNIILVIDIHGKNLGSERLTELKGNKEFIRKYKIEVSNFSDNKQETLAEELDDLVSGLQIEIREDGRVRTIDEEKYRETQKVVDDLMVKLINES